MRDFDVFLFLYLLLRKEHVFIMQNKKKTLKVYSCFYQGSGNLYPRINLQGKWLNQFGFDISNYVEVIMDNDMIIIKKINQVENLLKISVKTTLEHQLHMLVQEEAQTYQIKEDEVVEKIVKHYFKRKKESK